MANAVTVAVNEKLEVVAARQSTTLYKRAILGDVEGIRQMASAGMDVDMKDSAGNSPLSLAAFHGQEEAFKCLVSFNANMETKDAKTWTVMHCAVAGGKINMVRFLCQKMEVSPVLPKVKAKKGNQHGSHSEIGIPRGHEAPNVGVYNGDSGFSIFKGLDPIGSVVFYDNVIGAIEIFKFNTAFAFKFLNEMAMPMKSR